MSEQVEVALITWGIKARDVLAAHVDRYWLSVEGHKVSDDASLSGVVVRRRFAVIDPHTDAERLQDLYIEAERLGLSGLSMQSALMKFANPKPPKPDEPETFGSVVVDARGTEWVRTSDSAATNYALPWAHGAERRPWSTVDAVEVIREGL